MSLAFKEMRMDQIRCREWRHVPRLQEDEVDQVRDEDEDHVRRHQEDGG